MAECFNNLLRWTSLASLSSDWWPQVANYTNKDYNKETNKQNERKTKNNPKELVV